MCCTNFCCTKLWEVLTFIMYTMIAVYQFLLEKNFVWCTLGFVFQALLYGLSGTFFDKFFPSELLDHWVYLLTRGQLLVYIVGHLWFKVIYITPDDIMLIRLGHPLDDTTTNYARLKSLFRDTFCFIQPGVYHNKFSSEYFTTKPESIAQFE